jgi:serine/threonine protein kinase/tetratricopeptide (TPR) repeat protein
MPGETLDEKTIFNVARRIGSPDARAEYLRQACGADSGLRGRVEVLLHAYEEQASFLESPPVGATPTIDQPAAESPGAVIGPYKLIEPIGEGGMGAVWMAQQTDPVKRLVALKLVKPGMDSKQVIARFEAERQALALMDHPNIARVLDGGTTSTGRPYFVMDLVKGVPVTKYCDDHRLTPRQRLELFIPVCQAVQHAHQKGVIHRDIKPSNVLVAQYDGRPVPKVIDFGVAKAAGQALTDRTLVTGFGAVVGTLEYMSPEQAEVNQLDVDTRSDIYSLGVLLYELLAGSPPFTRKELEKAGLLEMLRVIREQEPSKPSTKLSTADGLPALAANRGTEPAKLTRLVRGELDWIVMKALEKDRGRRYETANGFAADVQRYLCGEAVQAVPPSTTYRLKKFARRNQPQVIAAGLVFVALVAGVVGTTLGLVQANQAAEAERVARDDAVEQKRLAEQAAEEERQAKVREAQRADGEQKAKLLADERRKEAERNLVFARKGNQILGSVFAGLDPRKIAESGRPLQDVLRENLTAAVKELEGSAIGDPLEVAAMQNTLGWSLVALGESALAVEVLQKSLATLKARRGPDHAETLTVMCNLGTAYKVGGQLDKAVPLYEESLKRLKATLGPDHRWTLTTMNNLGTAYVDSRQLDKALPLHEEALARRKATLGPDDPDTLQSMCNLATVYQDSRQLDKALPLYKETLSKWKKRDPDHPDTLTIMNNLATAYVDTRQPDKAVPLFEETLEKSKAKLGPGHPDTLACMYNLTVAYRQSGRPDKALPLLEDSLKKREARYGPDDPDTLGTMGALGKTYCEANRGEKAAITFAEFVDRHRKRAPKDSPQFAGLLAQVSLELVRCGQHAAAEPLLRECLGIREKKEPDAWATFNTQSLLGTSLLGQKKYEGAEPLLLKGYQGMKAREKTIPPQADKRIPETLDRLVELYTATGKFAEAEKWRAERAKYPSLAPPREKK